MSGKVYLVGAGPGDPELLTVKALRLLQTADAVLHDDLVAPEILKLISATAQVRDVGKRCGTKTIRQEEINFLMVELGRSGLQVVRLKSGDPFIFGRGGEEMEALRRANIDYEVVPGVTSALGAAAAAQIPLTHRGTSSAVVFITAHRAARTHLAKAASKAKNVSSVRTDWKRFAGSDSTLVIYMPGQDHCVVASELKSAGYSGDTPCAIISRATTRDQRVQTTTLKKLCMLPQAAAPALLVVGEVVRYANPVLLAGTLPEGLLQERFSRDLDVTVNPEVRL